jgi:hypothetical protein
MNHRSQRSQIIDYLATGHPLTALQALRKFGTMKLATRVSELRSAHHGIKDRWIEQRGKRFKQYYLPRG